MTRPISARYSDPLDLIWINAAAKMGLEIQRSGDTYASSDGHGTLRLSVREHMDPDDCLAQMILHEICHWMVQGVHSLGWVDWGLDNEATVDREKEHACLRLQAALLEPYGLRGALAPTTDFRLFYDGLPEDPFSPTNDSELESIVRARAAYARRDHRPFREHLSSALQATKTILSLAKKSQPEGSSTEQLCSRLSDPLPIHPTGLPMYPQSLSVCQSCAWFHASEGQAWGRCRTSNRRTNGQNPACCHFEAAFDCLSCGACCREAYDAVEVGRRDPAAKLHLNLLIERPDGFDMGRRGSRCACLQGGLELAPTRPSISGGTTSDDAGAALPPLNLPGGAPFTCSIYETRPKTCRDFTIFSKNCLDARRRVGLSR